MRLNLLRREGEEAAARIVAPTVPFSFDELALEVERAYGRLRRRHPGAQREVVDMAYQVAVCSLVSPLRVVREVGRVRE